MMKRIALVSCLLAVVAISFSCGDGAGKELENLYASFVDPPMESRPFVRWWWNGAKLTAEEIDRELGVMQDAGIGGVEINTIRFPGGDDLGIPSLDYMSPEWIAMVKSAIESASRRGMTCDIIVGSGWPFGAESLPRDERAEVLLTYAKEVPAGETLEMSLFHLYKELDPGVTIVNPEYTPVYTWKYKQDGRFYYRCLAADRPAPDGMDAEQQKMMSKALDTVRVAMKDTPVEERTVDE